MKNENCNGADCAQLSHDLPGDLLASGTPVESPALGVAVPPENSGFGTAAPVAIGRENVPRLTCGASTSTILALIRKARQGRRPLLASEVPFGERIVAIAMVIRGVGLEDVLDVFGVTATEYDRWIDEVGAIRPISDFELDVRLWAAMLEQAPQDRRQADEIVFADCCAMNHFRSCTLEDAAVEFMIINELLSSPYRLESYFDPKSEAAVQARPSPAAMHQLFRAVERVRKSERPHHSHHVGFKRPGSDYSHDPHQLAFRSLNPTPVGRSMAIMTRGFVGTES